MLDIVEQGQTKDVLVTVLAGDDVITCPAAELEPLALKAAVRVPPASAVKTDSSITEFAVLGTIAETLTRAKVVD